MRQGAVAVALGVVLVGLALLQYRWLGDVSAAERERMRANLQSRASDVAQALDTELTRMFVAFRVDADRLDSDAAGAIGEAYAQWKATAAHPALVRAIDIVDPNDAATVRRFDAAANGWSTSAWPPALRDWMARLSRAVPKVPNAPPPLLLADAVDGLIPAVVIAVPNLKTAEPGTVRVVGDPASLARNIVVELDAAALRDRLLAPAIVRYFGPASETIVTIVPRDDPSRVVFASDPERPLTEATADVSAPLFDLRMDELERLAASVPAGDGRGKMAITIVRRANTPEGHRFVAVGNRVYPAAWRLLARYRSDSLDALVTRSRRRNFGLVAAVLLVLGATVSLMMISAERARRLARQQMEFVASVSHELRTPLAVIRSAGENLADGVVCEPAQVKRYGSLVETESRRLGDMVERVLLFAGIGSGARTRAFGDVDLARVVTDAVDTVAAEARDRGVDVVAQTPALPTIAGDADALRSAVQNVVGNAVKYSRSGGSVQVVAEAVGESVIRIRVSDSGIGIDAADLPYIFRPFYRGRRAIDAQIRGTGIGLSVVRHVIRTHGGDVTVDSRPDEGTTVTMVLPVRSIAQVGERRGRAVRLKQAGVRS